MSTLSRPPSPAHAAARTAPAPTPERACTAERRTRGACAALLFAVVVAACGGGSSGTPVATAGNSPAPAPPPAAQAALTITSFTPATGPAGTVVMVSGTALDGVTVATVGSATASFTKVSATQLQLTVPAAATSGRIAVSGAGRSAASGTDFVVTPAAAPPATAPAVTAVAPATVIAGIGRLTLTGTALDQVASARLDGTALTIASQAATSLVLNVPAGAAAAAAATLSLTDRAGTARNVAQPITVLAALAVTGFTPTTIARGQTLTVTGRGLDRVTEVRFGGTAATAAVASRSGTTSLTALVPSTAATGPISVVGAVVNGVTEQAASGAALTVLEPIVVTPQTHNVAAAGVPVTVNGSGLAQVSSVLVGNVAATVTAQANTALTFTVPAGVTCGAITLRATGLPDVNAGSVVVGAGCALRAAAVEFAQLMSQPAGDRYQRLAAGRETWVRAYVVSASAGTPAPAVRALGTSGSGQALGAVALSGPATLPVLAPTAAVTDVMRYDDAASFNAELPAAWVQPGLRVRIEVGDAAAPAATAEASPLVASSGGLRVVLVPLVSGANVPTMPTVADAQAELQRKLPLPAGQISVRIRAPYTLTSATAGVVDSAQWSAALSELERLRDTEAPNDLYYGMVRPLVSAGIAGIGYVNTIGSRSPSLASLGWDSSRTTWRRTMIHELGHNFSRPHAPCGNVAGADANYPYANGALGPTPLFDILANDVLSPANQTDIMGYCSGQWFSDYNLNGVSRFLEGRPAALMDVGMDASLEVAAGKPPSTQVTQGTQGTQGTLGSGELLVVSGTVEASGEVRLAPVRAVRADGRREAAPEAAGAYLLRVVMVDGRRIERRFEPTLLDHAPGEGHFLLRLPHPGGAVGRVEVLRERATMASRASAKVAGAATAAAAAGASSGAAAAVGPWAEVRRDGDALALQWSAGDQPYASLTLVVGAQRHVLALDATGGRWRIAADAWRALPAGGHFEVSLSDGVETVLLIVPRD